MSRTTVKRAAALLVGGLCLYLVMRLFDWHAVAAALANIRLGFFLLCVPVFLFSLFLRGARWLHLLHMERTPRMLAQSFLANSVSAGLGSFTPLQLGELIKLRLLKTEQKIGLHHTLPAFLSERMLDVAAMVGVGLAGWAVHAGLWIAAPPLVLSPFLAAALLAYSGPWLADRLPARWRPITQEWRRPAEVFMATGYTIVIWLLNAAAWWIATHAIGTATTFSQAMLLLGGSTLASIGSMVPAGLGASELSTRGILMLLGFDRAGAESAAIAIRLLTPVLMALGAMAATVLALRGRNNA